MPLSQIPVASLEGRLSGKLRASSLDGQRSRPRGLVMQTSRYVARWTRLTIIPIVLATLPMEATPQSIIDWREFDLCDRCSLTTTEVVRIGDAEGPGVILSDWTTVVAKPEPDGDFLLFSAGGDRVQVFDRTGRFRAVVGRSGEGPGEFVRIVNATFAPSGHVLALDGARHALLRFTESGDFVDEVRLQGIQPGMFRLAPGDSIVVVGKLGQRPATAGYALHLVQLESGVTVSHFAETAGALSWHVVVLEETDRLRRSSIWWSPGREPRFEEWSLDNSLLRRVKGDLPWFETPSGSENSGRPPSAVRSFAVDDADRLWLMSEVADPEWHEVPRAGIEGGVDLRNLDDFLDARLDVFDLRTKRQLGSRRWDSVLRTHLVMHHGEVLVSALDYETPVWPRIVLYAVAFQ